MPIYNTTRTGARFHADNSFFRLNNGAVRTGKSVRCQMDIIKRMAEQGKARDGYRYSKWLIGRKSYPQLKSTTIATWKHWVPEQFGRIKYDSPITQEINYRDIRAQILFMPFESEKDVDKLKSLELTGAYFNEAQYLPQSIITTALERCNSYPPKDMGAEITFSGVWADTNPPPTSHWIPKLEKNLPENYKYFHDFPAVIPVKEIPKDTQYARSRDGTIYINNPEADYIQYLPTSLYYLNQIPGLADEEVKVTCMGQYGFTRVGRPVYPDYNDVIHYRDVRYRYNVTETLYMGWDFGLTPAVVLYQWQANKHLACIGEITSEDYGVEKFAERYVLPYLNEHCPGWGRSFVSIGDPSGIKGNEQTAQPGSKNSSFDALTRLGIMTRPARSNALERRIGAVAWFLRQMHNGRGLLQLGNNSHVLRDGFLGDYQYEKMVVGGLEESIRPMPLKNFSSHIHDGNQYILMYLRDTIDNSNEREYDLSGSRIY
jgi:hypothetical protein